MVAEMTAVNCHHCHRYVTLSLSASALEREYERIALRLVAVDGILRQPAVIISTA